MDFKNKGFWLTLILLGAGGLISLAGAIIGRVVLGWTLFAAGIILLIVAVVLRFNELKEFYLTKRTWSWIGAGVLVVLLGIAIVVMLASSNAATAGTPAGGIPTQMAGAPAASLDVPTVEASATSAAPSATATTAIETAAPEVTETPAATETSSIFVCLNENAPYGYRPRIAPRTDAEFGGSLEWGSCFTVDGRASEFPGWYHITKGQNGTTGVAISDTMESKYQMWIDGYYLESFGDDLNSLPEITVQTK